jgi:hypothetical protein
VEKPVLPGSVLSGNQQVRRFKLNPLQQMPGLNI